MAVTTTTNAAISTTLPTRSRLNWPVTLGVAFRCLGTPLNNSTFFGISYTTSVSSPYWDCGIYYASPNITLRWASGSTPQSLASAITPTAGVDYVVFAVVTAAAQSLYVNGVLTSSSTASSNPTYSSTSQIGFGAFPASGGANNCAYYWGNIWNIALPASTIGAIGKNVNTIWQMMRPTYRYLDSIVTPYAFTPWLYTNDDL